MSTKKRWRDRLAGYPGGIESQMTRLEAEGHTVVQRGKRYFVEDFAKKLARTR